MSKFYYAIGYDTETGRWVADTDGTIIGDNVDDGGIMRSPVGVEVAVDRVTFDMLCKILEAVNLGIALKQRTIGNN